MEVLLNLCFFFSNFPIPFYLKANNGQCLFVNSIVPVVYVGSLFARFRANFLSTFRIIGYRFLTELFFLSFPSIGIEKDINGVSVERILFML